MAITPASSTGTAASSSAASVNSTVKLSGQSMVTSMGLGSGVDLQALAQSLVSASRAPQENSINKKISQSEARISGYAALSYMVSNLKDKFAALDKVADYNTQTVSSSQAASVTASITGSPSPGNHQITVNRLAQGKRVISESGFADPNETVGAKTIDMQLGGQSLQQVSVGQDAKISDLVAAMNSAWKASGVTVQLVNRGAAAPDTDKPYHLLITGPTGQANDFTLTGLDLNLETKQSPLDARLSVDGVDIESSSNTVTEAISGLTLQLNALTPEAGASLQVTRDLAPIKTKISELVTAYNDLNSVLTDTASPNSKVSEYGATLVGDSTVDAIRRQVRALFLPGASSSGSGLTSLRDLGISIDKTGKMTLDDKQLGKVLSSRFDEAVKMLTNNQSTATETLVSEASLPGQARNAVMTLANMLRSYAPLNTQSNNAKAQIAKYKTDLERLDARMNQLLERYNKQFTAMESLVNQTNSLKTSLKSSFDGMASAYSKN